MQTSPSERSTYLLVSIGESKSPGVVNEEDIRVLRHGLRSENELSLRSFVARLDLEKRAAIEGLRGELREELAVQILRESRGLEKKAMDFLKVVVGFNFPGGHRRELDDGVQ